MVWITLLRLNSKLIFVVLKYRSVCNMEITAVFIDIKSTPKALIYFQFFPDGELKPQIAVLSVAIILFSHIKRVVVYPLNQGIFFLSTSKVLPLR